MSPIHFLPPALSSCLPPTLMPSTCRIYGQSNLNKKSHWTKEETHKNCGCLAMFRCCWRPSIGCSLCWQGCSLGVTSSLVHWAPLGGLSLPSIRHGHMNSGHCTPRPFLELMAVWPNSCGFEDSRISNRLNSQVLQASVCLSHNVINSQT